MVADCPQPRHVPDQNEVGPRIEGVEPAGSIEEGIQAAHVGLGDPLDQSVPDGLGRAAMACSCGDVPDKNADGSSGRASLYLDTAQYYTTETRNNHGDTEKNLG